MRRGLLGFGCCWVSLWQHGLPLHHHRHHHHLNHCDHPHPHHHPHPPREEVDFGVRRYGEAVDELNGRCENIFRDNYDDDDKDDDNDKDNDKDNDDDDDNDNGDDNGDDNDDDDDNGDDNDKDDDNEDDDNAEIIAGGSTANIDGGSNGATLHFCTAADLTGVDAWIFDVGGTVRKPKRPEESEEGETVRRLFQHFLETGTAFGFLSNRIRTAEDVAEKISDVVGFNIETWRVHTAGVALGEFMMKHVAEGSKIMCIGTDSTTTIAGAKRDDLPGMLVNDLVGDKNLALSWEIRNSIEWDEALSWANQATEGSVKVYVVLALGDGLFQIDFDKISKVGLLLRNSAALIVAGSETGWRPPTDEKTLRAAGKVDFILPTTGGIEALFLTSAEIMFDDGRAQKAGAPRRHYNVGKGGNVGREYMAMPLIAQIAEGNEKEKKRMHHPGFKSVGIVGDDLGTDIAFGARLGWRTVFVLGGIHRLEDVRRWSGKPTCYVSSVGDLHAILDDGKERADDQR